MKKLILTVIMVLMGIPAMAQFNYNRFVIGDYTFVSTRVPVVLSAAALGLGLGSVYIDYGGGFFELVRTRDYTSSEITNLYNFIRNNKGKLEEKYSIIIKSVHSNGYYIEVEAYDKNMYEERQREAKAAKAKEQQEAQTRMNSLNNLL